MAELATDPIAFINDSYRAKHEREKQVAERGVVRASSIGYDLRRLLFQYYQDEFPPIPIEPRAVRTFEVGDDRHLRLQSVMASYPGGDFRTSKSEEEIVSMAIPNSDWIIRGHLDGYIESMPWNGAPRKRVVVDFKTANSKGWDWTKRDEVGETYKAQAQMYMRMKDASWHWWCFENKDTQELHGTIVPHNKGESDFLVEKAQDVAKNIDNGVKPMDVYKCHGEDFGFETKKIMIAKSPRRYGFVEKAKWGCSYCSYWRYCFPQAVKIRHGGKQILLANEEMVYDGAKVIDSGPDATPRDTWEFEV